MVKTMRAPVAIELIESETRKFERIKIHSTKIDKRKTGVHKPTKSKASEAEGSALKAV